MLLVGRSSLELDASASVDSQTPPQPQSEPRAPAAVARRNSKRWQQPSASENTGMPWSAASLDSVIAGSAAIGGRRSRDGSWQPPVPPRPPRIKSDGARGARNLGALTAQAHTCKSRHSRRAVPQKAERPLLCHAQMASSRIFSPSPSRSPLRQARACHRHRNPLIRSHRLLAKSLSRTTCYTA